MTNYLILPKAELHCHLVGVINPGLLKRIQSAGGAVLIKPEALERYYPICDLGGFKRWMRMLKPYQATTWKMMQPILASHVNQLIEQHVVYTEIMLSPTMFPHELSALITAFRHWREWTFELERGRIQIEFIMVVPRTLDIDTVQHDTAAFIELKRRNLIAGVALVGIENGESIKKFSSFISKWRDVGLGIEIHAGEHEGPRAIWDALEYGRPDRLGHSVSAFQDRTLVDYIARHNIHIEFCLTSNLRLGVKRNLQQHPICQAQETGIRFSLNTDNPGTFEISMNHEYELAMKALSYRKMHFMDIFHSSLAARFQTQLRFSPYVL